MDGPRYLGRTLFAAAAALLLVVAGTVLAPPASASPSVTLVGHGYGHGKGLGQWGAFGYAVDQGWTSAMILDHYYGGTRPGSRQGAGISVALLSTPATTWITSRNGFTVGDPADPAAPRQKVSGGSAARVTHDSSGWKVWTTFNGCGATDNFGPFTVSSPAFTLDADPGPSGLAPSLLTACATGTAYRGSLRAALSGTSVLMVNDLPMEQYLRSVVPAESPASWADARGGWGIQALQAQAVAARSYAASEARYAYAQTCDTTSCQVYPGAFRNGTALEDPRTDRAVAATSGVVRVSTTGAVVRTEFSASTGGFTAGGSFPRVEDEGDSRSPHHTWVAQLDGAALASTYGVGTFRQLLVTDQAPGGPEGGRVLQVRIDGSAGSRSVGGADFRLTWGLKSDWFFPVVQPVQQITDTAYVKHAYADAVYRQFSLAWNNWSDHAPMSYPEYVAAGSPTPTSVPTDYVKYPWSSTLYAVTYWPREPSWQWHQLTYAEWGLAGFPAPRNAGFVYGTMFYTVGSSPVIYAQGPDDVVHALTWSEWQAAGFPSPVRR